MSLESLYAHFKSRKEGLTSKEAKRRLKIYGLNALRPPKKGRGIILLLDQFKTPLVLLLIGAALLSFYLGGKVDASIIFTIVLLSGLLGFFQERGALNALSKLMALVENKAAVLRDGKEIEISIALVVPGDIVVLRAGDIVPGDAILIEASQVFVDEAVLTGESISIEKMPGEVSADTSLGKRTNMVFLGTSIASGSCKAIIVGTGKETEYSKIAENIRKKPPATAFETGVRQFGLFLLKVTLILVIAIFIINTLLHRLVVEALLFSLALAVGLTPQLLPAIITVNLSHGARRMAKKRVIVKRLAAIENFGHINILCTDKTGTLTTGKMGFDRGVNFEGIPSEKVHFYSFLNAKFQNGYVNPIDKAILEKGSFTEDGWSKIKEIPYDFARKRVSILFQKEGKKLLITKGAFLEVIALCNRIEAKEIAPIESYKAALTTYFEKSCGEGLRTLAVAYSEGEEEKDLIFLGFLHFFDPVKEGVKETIDTLLEKGVHVKIITGDHESVAMYVASKIQLEKIAMITGSDLFHLGEADFIKAVLEHNIFAEIEPNQKEKIILALRKSGSIVGYMGDGVNDVAALHAADIGIAVDGGSEAAKEIADVVLLEKDLSVLEDGIEEGRSTFANTLKYIYMATSANFGNMFSMAGASIFLSFLPLLPKQVLLTNFLSDFPEMALATDRVDKEVVTRPVIWDLKFIRRFMLIFGLLSSIADYMTFGILIWMGADETLFRTGWFVESVISATLIVLVIRTRGSMFRSRPSNLLLVAVIGIVLATLFLPITPLGPLLGFTKLPLLFYAVLGGIILYYIVSVEVAKRIFFKYKKASDLKRPA